MVDGRLSHVQRPGRKSAASKSGLTKERGAKVSYSKLRGRPLRGQPQPDGHPQSLKATEIQFETHSRGPANEQRAARQVGWSTRRLKKFRKHGQSLREDYHTWLRNVLVEIYEIAIGLRSDENEWKAFCRDPEWHDFRGRPVAANDQDDILKHTIRFFAGFAGRGANLRANRLMKRLQLFQDLSASAEEVHHQLFTCRIGNEKDTSAEHESTRSASIKITAHWRRDHKRELAKLGDGDDIIIRARVRGEGSSRVLKVLSFEAAD